MGMGLCARSNPLSIHLFCSPASHCAPRLNRPGKKIWTCDCNVIQNKTTALTGRFFFLTSKQNLCSRSFRVNVWMEVNACTVCVCVCPFCPLSCFYFWSSLIVKWSQTWQKYCSFSLFFFLASTVFETIPFFLSPLLISLSPVWPPLET